MKSFEIVARVAIVLLMAPVILFYTAVRTNEKTIDDYEVRGVDVSAYQGDIDWVELSKNDIDFAFIKATEGSSYCDRFYKKNIEGIRKTDIAAGAYHFMSFESDGKTQAANFIATVSKDDISLPPVIDVELYGEFMDNTPKASHVREILDEIVDAFYEEYGTYPIIYTNRKAYALYISGKYKQCDIWMCDLVKTPELSDGRKWTFWQYSHTGKFSGYRGAEENIDLNVFYGTQKQFEKYKKG